MSAGTCGGPASSPRSATSRPRRTSPARRCHHLNPNLRTDRLALQGREHGGHPDPARRGARPMKAVRVHSYGKRPSVDEVPEPKITGPFDVLVQVGAAGLCRTDLHIVEGQWAERSGVELPYIIGHENAGWVREVGSAVTSVAPGDAVILHPLVTCGLCRACRSGDDVHCENSQFPGIDTDGGMAELLRTTARSCVRLRPGLE